MSLEFFRFICDSSLELYGILKSPKGNTLNKNEREDFNMFNSLDLLVIVFVVLTAATLLSGCLMFLMRNRSVRRVCFYIVSVLGIYLGSVGAYIGFGMFPLQTLIGIAAILACIGAIVLERVKKNDDKMFLIVRIVSAVSLVIALFNTAL